jgi:hypothetical protein
MRGREHRGGEGGGVEEEEEDEEEEEEEKEKRREGKACPSEGLVHCSASSNATTRTFCSVLSSRGREGVRGT